MTELTYRRYCKSSETKWKLTITKLIHIGPGVCTDHCYHRLSLFLSSSTRITFYPLWVYSGSWNLVCPHILAWLETDKLSFRCNDVSKYRKDKGCLLSWTFAQSPLVLSRDNHLSLIPIHDQLSLHHITCSDRKWSPHAGRWCQKITTTCRQVVPKNNHYLPAGGAKK